MDVLDREPPKADKRLPYGNGAFQFGDLCVPAGAKSGALAPVVLVVHGGWWQSAYDLGYCGFMCQALKAVGVATWSIEYRRVGNEGGGWPGTMQDVAAGFDFLATLAKAYPLNLGRVVATGHSAGGHLAFWLAGRHHVPPGSPLHEPQPKVVLKGLVGLAGAVDLRLTPGPGRAVFVHEWQALRGELDGWDAEGVSGAVRCRESWGFIAVECAAGAGARGSR